MSWVANMSALNCGLKKEETIYTQAKIFNGAGHLGRLTAFLWEGKLVNIKICNGQIVGQPSERERERMLTKRLKNVDEMSEKYPKIVVRRGQEPNFGTFFGQVLPILLMFLCGDPVQCSHVTN